MSEQAPERAPTSRGSKFGLFTEKIGPLPMWAWVAIIAAGIVAWRIYSNKKNASSTAASSTAADSTGADQVPQFVNQTYVTTTPPVQGAPAPSPSPVTIGPIESFGPRPVPTPTPVPGKGPGPKPPGPMTLTRTWESLGGSTYAQVAQRLLGNADVQNLHPADAKTAKWVSTVYAKNHNAKMPKGLHFTYTEGTITPKASVK